jgi:hypothetical protein
MIVILVEGKASSESIKGEARQSKKKWYGRGFQD